MTARAIISIVIGFVVVTVLAPDALAAPQRLASDPEEGAELHEAPDEVSITFSEPLLEGSELRVLDECEQRIDDGSSEISVNELTVGIERPRPGMYSVTYTAVGPSGTGTGGFTFTVHGSPDCDSAPGGHHEDGGGGGHGPGHGDGGGSGGTDTEHEKDGHKREGSNGPDHAGGSAHNSGVHSAGGAAHTSESGHGSTAGNGHDPDHDSGGRDEDAPLRALDDGSGSLQAAPADAVDQVSANKSSWATVIGFVIAALFGVAGGWLLRGYWPRFAGKRGQASP